jgi:hypothetical protein
MTSNNSSSSSLLWFLATVLCLLGMAWDVSTSIWGFLNIFSISPEFSRKFVLNHIPQVFLCSFCGLLLMTCDFIVVNPIKLDEISDNLSSVFSLFSSRNTKKILVGLWIVWKLYDFSTTYMGTAYFFLGETVVSKTTNLLQLLQYMKFDEFIALLFPSILISCCSLSWDYVANQFFKSTR